MSNTDKCLYCGKDVSDLGTQICCFCKEVLNQIRQLPPKKRIKAFQGLRGKYDKKTVYNQPNKRRYKNKYK